MNVKEKENAVILKKGKDKAILNRHHWIFSMAVETFPTFKDGEILPVLNCEEEFLGYGYFNRKSSLVGRMLNFDERAPVEALKANIENAIAQRMAFFNPTITNAYRLINGEGDFLPGLIVDKYDDVLVIQISTLGMDLLKPTVIAILEKALSPKAIYEKSTMSVRKEEGLRPLEMLHKGKSISPVRIRENGLKFIVDISKGQKTGFFLDHRKMRQQVKTLSSKKRVLNCFCYTGGFSIYAAAGGASQVDSVDISKEAIQLARENMALNGFTGEAYQTREADVFDFLRENPLDYDLIILDPPAFAKKKQDIIAACRGYKDINRICMHKMPAKSLLLTSSCSYYVDEILFQKVIFQAAVDAGRRVKIIGKHELASDHPINVCHPEGQYLKSLLLYVE